jgi:YHS domain-containing protein
MSFDTLVNIAIFAVALFLMFRFGCGRHMMGHAHSEAHAGAHGGSGGPPVGVDEDVDPVCGMVVSGSSSTTATYEGRTYYFCSDSCRRRFESSPATSAAKATPHADEAGHRHGCC